jgi:AcrR family transcriptional regulator
MGVAERKSRQKESTRQEILDAARDLFVNEGFDNVSMRKIAERVEYAPGTIYLYFKDKAEILDTLCEQTFEKLHARMEAIRQDSGNPLEGLRRGLRTYIQFGLDNPNHYIVTFVLAKTRPEVHDGEGKKAGMSCFECLQGVVHNCMEAGYVEAGDPAETAQAIWTAIHGVTSLLVSKCSFPFVEETRLIERLIDILIKGIRTDKT